MATLKTCFKCGVAKELDEFYKHPDMADGHVNKCKPCNRKDCRDSRERRVEYYRAYDSERYKNNPQRKAAAISTFKAAQKKRPERIRAAQILGAAVRRGEVIKMLCWVCGGKAEAHHPDYSQPLDVVWLCRAHHLQAHGMAKRINE